MNDKAKRPVREPRRVEDRKPTDKPEERKPDAKPEGREPVGDRKPNDHADRPSDDGRGPNDARH